MHVFKIWVLVSNANFRDEPTMQHFFSPSHYGILKCHIKGDPRTKARNTLYINQHEMLLSTFLHFITLLEQAYKSCQKLTFTNRSMKRMLQNYCIRIPRTYTF